MLEYGVYSHRAGVGGRVEESDYIFDSRLWKISCSDVELLSSRGPLAISMCVRLIGRKITHLLEQVLEEGHVHFEYQSELSSVFLRATKTVKIEQETRDL